MVQLKAKRKTSKRPSTKRSASNPAKRSTSNPAKRASTKRTPAKRASTKRTPAKRTAAKRSKTKKQSTKRTPAKRSSTKRVSSTRKTDGRRKNFIPEQQPDILADITPTLPDPERVHKERGGLVTQVSAKPGFEALGRKINRPIGVHLARPSPVKVQRYMADRFQRETYGSKACWGQIFLLLQDYTLDPEFLVPGVLGGAVKACKKGIIAQPITLLVSQGGGSDANHANMVIIDTAKNPIEIERYEPHGSWEGLFYDGKRVDDVLEAFFRSELGPNIRYVPIREAFPGLSLQGKHKKDDGLCACWSAFYAELRVQHPMMSRQEIATYMDSLTPEEVHDVSQDFIYAVEQDAPADPDASVGVWKMEVFHKIQTTTDVKTLPPPVLSKLVEVAGALEDVVSLKILRHCLFSLIARNTLTMYLDAPSSIMRNIIGCASDLYPRDWSPEQYAALFHQIESSGKLEEVLNVVVIAATGKVEWEEKPKIRSGVDAILLPNNDLNSVTENPV